MNWEIIISIDESTLAWFIAILKKDTHLRYFYKLKRFNAKDSEVLEDLFYYLIASIFYISIYYKCMYKVLVVLINFTFSDLRELDVIVLRVTKRTYRPMKWSQITKSAK